MLYIKDMDISPTASRLQVFSGLQASNADRLFAGHYFAFGFCSIMPKALPSVSWQVANHPIPGIGAFGIKTLPPLSRTVSANLSTEEG